MHLEVISPIEYIMIIKRYFRKLVMEKNLQWCMVWIKLNGHCPAAEGGYLFFRSAIADFSHALSKTSLIVSLFWERPKLFIYISTLAPSLFLRWIGIVTITINTGQKRCKRAGWEGPGSALYQSNEAHLVLSLRVGASGIGTHFNIAQRTALQA